MDRAARQCKRAITPCDRLSYRLNKLVDQMKRMIKNFDSELLCLRHKKIKLEIELKEASFMYAPRSPIHVF